MTERASLRRRGCMGGITAASSVRKLLVLATLWIHVCRSAVEAQSVQFTVKPTEFSSNATAAFAFSVVAGANGVDPCATASQCLFLCTLDQGVAQDCSGRTYSVSNLTDGSHKLTVSANTSSVAPGIYSWLVDTVPPTSSVVTSALYTSAINITVNITFSENCPAFQCSNVSSCDLVVFGPAVVIPATLVTLSPGLAYSVQVALSTQVPTGRVLLTTVRKIAGCTDAAGNRYQRSTNSSKVVHFSRIPPTLNLWTPLQNSQVDIGEQLVRTVQATNVVVPGEVNVYLDFSDPILTTVAELQAALNASHGVLLPRERKSRGNRRFAFSLWLNNTQSAAVTVMLPGNTTTSRYGSSVAETATVTFLHDIDKPEVLLSTNSRAHTRDSLLPVVVQFTKPVFSFNNSGVTLTGGLLQSFREISKTTYALVMLASEGSSTVAVSVAGNRTLDIAGNPNVASSTLQIKHYSSTPAISVALYSFITAGLLGTAFFSGALAISSSNLAAAGAVLGRSTSCVGADASRNLLGMAGHMQVLALTSFLAVSLPVEYAETANGLQWLIPHVSTPWQNNQATNYTTRFDSNQQTNLTLNLRRNLLHAPFQPQAPCTMMHHWPTQYGTLYSESLATTYWSGTYMEEFLNRESGRRRLGANGTEFGPAMVAAEYETWFLNQGASLRRLREDLLAKKYTGWSDFQRNMFWLAVVCGSLVLLHFLLLLFLRWRMRTPVLLHSALSFPRFELFLLILVLPAICQASAFVIRGGTKAGIAVGVVLLTIPALLLLMTTLLLVLGICRGQRVQYKELRPYLKQDEQLPPRPPLAFLTGEGYPGKWTRNEGTNRSFIPRFGILFEDRKGPPRLVTMMDDTTNANKTTSTAGSRRSMNSDDEHDERAVSRAYAALGCFQSAYILVDLSRRIALGVIFGAFQVTDKSWTQVSLALAVTAAQLLYLVTTKPFQRRFVQVVETVSLLCEIGIFISAMVILSHDRPYDANWGLGVFMLTLFVLSFFAQITNEWFALIRQLLWLSNTEEFAPKASLREFFLGLSLPLLPRRQWPQKFTNTTTPPAPTETPMIASTEPAAAASSSSPAVSSPRVVVGGVSKSAKPVMSPPEYWPGEDLQEWARQNSLERARQESELVVNPMVQEIANTEASKFHYDAPVATVVSRFRQRRSPRVHSDESLSSQDLVLSEGEFRLDSPEKTYSRQHSIDVGPESELVVNPMVQEIANTESSKYHYDAPVATVVSRRRSSDIIDEFSLDSPVRTYSRQHSIDVGPES